MRFGDLRSPSGYPLDEVTSALQKCIRRGLEREALYWASELHLAGYGQYLWKRLRIIASEDVGLADPHLPATIYALHQNWSSLRKEEKDRPPDQSDSTLFVVHAVLLLARAAKSRIVDHALYAVYRGDRPRLQVPDWALDCHTRRGRQMGRTEANYWDETYRLQGRALPDPYEDEARAAARSEARGKAGQRKPGQLKLG